MGKVPAAMGVKWALDGDVGVAAVLKSKMNCEAKAGALS
jgi:hypothetical protein